MTITELGSLGEFVGSIAVLVTLIYLVLQIRQNTQSIRSQSRFSVLETLNADMRQVQSKEFQDLQLAVTDGEASREEKNRWIFVLTGWLSHNEMLFYEIEDASLPKDFESTLRWRIFSLFSNPGASQVWQEMKGAFTPNFQEYVDELLASASTEEIGRHGARGFPDF
jgi:hypothetical protein